MEVILIKEVNRLGNPGDIVNVKNGYANNYLLPKKLAVKKTKTGLSILEKQQDEFQKIIAEKEAVYQGFIDKIEEIEEIELLVNASKEGKTFGAVTNMTIRDYLKEHHDLEIDRKYIIIKSIIKSIGDYEVEIHFNRKFNKILKLKVKGIEETKNS